MKKFFNFLILMLILLTNSSNSFGKNHPQDHNLPTDKFAIRRNKMVDQQIRRRGIKDTLVLNAMRKIPRHEFVPAHLKESAYTDRALPIGEGQTISQPYIVAIMTEQLALKGTEKVLEIGTGSGYQAAVLAEIADKVYTIEIVPSLGILAEQKLKKMGYKNVEVKIGDGYQGWPEQAPFDAIIVTAAPNHIPQPLIDQLKNNGRMIIPVGDYYQELMLLTKNKKGEIKKKSVLPVIFVPMTGKAREKKSN